MASGDATIWVKVEDGKGGRATSIDVPHDALIDKLVDKALVKEKVDITPRFVSIRFHGEEVPLDAEAKDYVAETSFRNPLLLVIDQEGESGH